MARFSEQHEILKGPRTRARRRMILKIVFAWVVIAVALGGGIYLAIATDVLAVKEVRVEGVRLAEHKKVIDVFADGVTRPPRSWFGDGSILFWIFLNPPTSFLDAFPMFRDIDVKVDIFSREVILRAEERELYGVWCLAHGDCYAFDNEGVIFGRAPATYGGLITKVVDTRIEPFRTGETVLMDNVWRERMLETLDVIDSVRLTPRVITVQEAPLREWDVALAEGPTLKFSFTFVPERLEDALDSLSRRGDFRTLTYLDFRVPDRLYYK